MPIKAKRPLYPGLRSTHLVVLGKADFGRSRWWVRCDCGVVKHMAQSNVLQCRSCGCMKAQIIRRARTVHGRAVEKGPTYRTWKGMRHRCNSPSHKSWKNYGGRGIRVCERWDSFENFLSDMGEKPEGMTLERIDNDGNYEPGNCRWATPKENCNNRRTSRILSLNGRSMTLEQWSDEVKIHSDTLSKRIASGWSVEKALTTPLKKIKSKRKQK